MPRSPARPAVLVLALIVATAVGRADVAVTPADRGPVHEGFAVPAGSPARAVVVRELPPADLAELPPAAKPGRDGVRWLPGYWQWDDGRAGFVWVPGCWRVPPAGRAWLPGHWHEVRGGWQWSPGFWHTGVAVEYLPPPPRTPAEETGPPPTDDSYYVSGSWAWTAADKYEWTPGFWTRHQPGRVWVPTRFVRTPAGVVRVAGYWDHPLADRGVVFAPVDVPAAVAGARGFVFTPTIAVPAGRLVENLYSRRDRVLLRRRLFLAAPPDGRVRSGRWSAAPVDVRGRLGPRPVADPGPPVDRALCSNTRTTRVGPKASATGGTNNLGRDRLAGSVHATGVVGRSG